MQTPSIAPANTLETLKTGWESWPSPVIARSEVGNFTGGLVSPRTISNLDCLKKGPQGRVRLGRKIGYLKSELIEWLTARLEA